MLTTAVGAKIDKTEAAGGKNLVRTVSAGSNRNSCRNLLTAAAGGKNLVETATGKEIRLQQEKEIDGSCRKRSFTAAVRNVI